MRTPPSYAATGGSCPWISRRELGPPPPGALAALNREVEGHPTAARSVAGAHRGRLQAGRGPLPRASRERSRPECPAATMSRFPPPPFLQAADVDASRGSEPRPQDPAPGSRDAGTRLCRALVDGAVGLAIRGALRLWRRPCPAWRYQGQARPTERRLTRDGNETQPADGLNCRESSGFRGNVLVVPGPRS